MAIRDRIKAFRRVKASSLKPNPSNWREHPEGQRKALEGILAEVGYADALLARELADDSLELVDGHLRADLDPEQEVPVLILDLDEAEAAKLLTVLDPLAAMAEANKEALGKLLAEVETGSDALREMLEGMASQAELPTRDQLAVEIGDTTYRVIVLVDDETEQANLIERLESEGLTCLPLMS